jgi:hypothetical protein
MLTHLHHNIIYHLHTAERFISAVSKIWQFYKCNLLADIYFHGFMKKKILLFFFFLKIYF